MNLISADHITVRFGDRTLLDDISLGIEQGEKLALVGVNGCGKSTFLKILAGVEMPAAGEVACRNGLNMAYLPQQPEIDPQLTVLQAVLDSDDPLMALVRRYEELLYRSATDLSATEELAAMAARMDALNAWNYESKAREILGKLDLHDLEQKVATLSGGQRKRVGLARVLLRQPELLLLDEPTNHLDLDVIEWLEDYLGTQQMSLLMVTHDRYFLERVTTGIVEIDEGKLYRYEGAYSDFLEKREERYANEKTKADRARNLLRKELEWVRRQPKARGTKAKYRVEGVEDLKKQAAARREDRKIELDITQRRLGGKVLELKGVSKSYGNQLVLPAFSYTFRKGERIGIVGRNGSGKTTFLDILGGRLTPDKGEVDIGVNTHIGYFRQEEPRFDPAKRVIDVVRDHAEVMKLNDGSEVSASQMLLRFSFPPAQQYDKVEKLSGGEKRRLQLLLVLLENPNFLMLDEPTNDLDLITLRVLEEFLTDYHGCLVLVSHDRYFMDRVVDHLFIISQGNPVRDFNGTYMDYREMKPAESGAEQKTGADKAEEDRKDRTKYRKEDDQPRLSFREKREMESLEKEMDELNERKMKLMELLNSGGLDHEQLLETSRSLEQVIGMLDEKEFRWLELSEKAP